MNVKPKKIKPKAGQESVWDYPRPPRAEATNRRIRVVAGGTTIADSVRAWRVLETSHPPVYYIPRSDIHMGYLTPGEGSSLCEWKGRAEYFDVRAGNFIARGAAWSYPEPKPGFNSIQGHIAFYASHVDACYVDDELVKPQPGGFYGGWITGDVIGPFKGVPGSNGW
jgi:uncharacterized protein (DUF427 family)